MVLSTCARGDVRSVSTEKPQPADVTPNRTPGPSKLTPEQRAAIEAALADPALPSLAKIARENNATVDAVRHLASKMGASPDRKLRQYSRRVSKRLPIPRRVELYAELAEVEIEDSRLAAVRLRALERMDSLEGIVTAREQRESESNQVAVSAMFVIGSSSAPDVAPIDVDVRPSQDES